METTDDWGVWCEVDGSMGYRAAWLKNEDGHNWFGTQDEAKAKAAEENRREKSPFSLAAFRYTAQAYIG